ncbi:VWA domain-containing protein [Methylocella sp.]|uniref:VWA domain-containing protein n=1 Tax=Methylocella sp. TaxID=1978226 RepID=UPI003784E05F
MLSFAYPWLALLAPLPALAYWLAPAYAPRRPALRAPFFATLARLTEASPGGRGGVEPGGLRRFLVPGLSWLLVLAALARPQWTLPPIHQDRPTRDLLLLVDLSASMDTPDFTDAAGARVSRLVAAKQALDDFLARRQGDRVGVVVFGDAPFPLVPFTADLGLARELLGEMQVGVAGPRTAFGDAIGLGLNLFSTSTAPAKTIIALTDGNDTASRVPLAEAAQAARDRGVVIHTVAVGDPAAAGEDKLDEAALRQVAEITGGGFYRAMDRAQLAQIYARLDQIETRRVDSVSFRPKVELYWAPLAGLLLLSMPAQALRLLRRPRRRAQEAVS